MNCRYGFYWSLLLVMSIGLGGCATLLNGPVQQVPMNIPERTKVNDPQVWMNRKTLLLKRDRSEYVILFSRNDERISVRLESHFQPAWLLADLFFDLWIVDVITQDWNAFDGIAVHFAGDTVNGTVVKAAYAELYDPSAPPLGIVVLAGGGYGIPFDHNNRDLQLPNVGIVGVGYEITPRLTALLTYSSVGAIDILAANTAFPSSFGYSAYQVESHFFFSGDYYAAGGGGLAHIKSNNTTPALDDHLLSVFAGIGLTTPIAYVELRHTIGLTSYTFPNKEIGRLGITAVNFGLNLRF